MPSAALLLAYVTLQRIAELFIARRNTGALLARGAREFGAGHYPVMVALHAVWLVTLWAFGSRHDVVPAFIVPVVALQLARVWVLRTLGARWTTRIIVLPGEPLVRTGPFRFVRHPNYAIVAFELPCISLAVGLIWHAIAFGILNVAMLTWRIRAEDRALAA